MLSNQLFKLMLAGQCRSINQIVIMLQRNYSPAERPPLTDREKRLYPQVEQTFTDEGFPILKFKPRKRNVFENRPKLVRRRSTFRLTMREEKMKEDQDWPSIWPTAKTFVPSAVPLPLRQSYESVAGAVPLGKYVNTELIKVVNFLHLTPEAIRRQCRAIKQFCTVWPDGLDTDEEVRAHFPVTYITRDYVHSSPSIRDPRARIVELVVNVDDLKLNEKDRRKLIELARDRYNSETGLLRIVTDACPTRIQNQDYSDYLLSAVYYEMLAGQCRSINQIVIMLQRNYSPAERPPLTDREKRLYPQVEQTFTDEGFPILKFKPRKRNVFENRPKLVRRRSTFRLTMREEKMKEDQDWPSIWPTAKTFVPSAVPLPLRQSYESVAGAVPLGKYVNTELIKVVNFLHLTPEAIRRQCRAIKQFCTVWPDGLDTDEEVRAHFPVTYITRDYVHSSPSIRDPRARIVELVVNVDDLKLNEKDRRKLIELARDRYNSETGLLRIVTDACPTRIQNQDYSDYLLSAVYYESQEHQDWESEYVDEERIYKLDLDKYREEVEQKLGLKKQ